MTLTPYEDAERELAVFSLAFRMARRERRDLPSLSALSHDDLIGLVATFENHLFTSAKSVVEGSLSKGIKPLSCLSQNYPNSLLSISGAPELLFFKGDISQPIANPTIAIVGSRSPTADGREFAFKLAYDITQAGGRVISGLAYGCDAAAHSGAIKAAKENSSLHPGYAVLGSGLGNIYPAKNVSLAESIINLGGAIVSESEPDFPPLRASFPARNRIVSGLSSAVIVVEANDRSGSLITARYAAEQGRDLYAVPGSPRIHTSRGTNQLLKDGAIPLTDFSDLKPLFPNSQPSPQTTRNYPDPILKTLSTQTSCSLNELCELLSSSPAEILPKLIKYELEGTIDSDAGRFRLVL